MSLGGEGKGMLNKWPVNSIKGGMAGQKTATYPAIFGL
jgi:hypothetical protein